jgi:hypothetical protein
MADITIASRSDILSNLPAGVDGLPVVRIE